MVIYFSIFDYGMMVNLLYYVTKPCYNESSKPFEPVNQLTKSIIKKMLFEKLKYLFCLENLVFLQG